MNIAELWLKLGLKGDKEAQKGLKEVNKNLKETASSSLEAKAAIAAVLFGLERLTGHASQIGMNLEKFAVSTGLSTDELQKWQYALDRFDVSGQETEQTIRNVQTAMTDMLLGKGAPEGLGVLADKVGFDMDKAQDTFYVMKKIQEFAKTMPPDVAAGVLKGFNISPNMLQGLKMMNLEVDKIPQNLKVTQNEQKKLVEINKVWKDIWFELEAVSTKAVAKNGLSFVKSFAETIKYLVNGALYVMDLIQKFDQLKAVLLVVGAVLAVIFAPITTAVAAVAALLADLEKWREGKDSAIGGAVKSYEGLDVGKAFKDTLTGGGLPMAPEAGGPHANDQSVWEGMKSFFSTGTAMPLAPMAAGGGGSTSTTNQTNTFNIVGDKDPEATAKAIQKTLSNAGRQSGALTEGR